jgi:uncharacterized membrane protein
MTLRTRSEGRRWLGVGLVLSLALNAFFIGAAATDLIRFDKDRDGRGHGVLRYELRWLAARLPPDAMAAIEAAVAADRPNARRHVERLHVLRADLGTLLAVEAPDRAAINAKLAAIRSELDAMLGSAQAATIDSLLTLPPETRKTLAGN